MGTQTTYLEDFSAVPGGLATEGGSFAVVVPRTNAEASANIVMGTGVALNDGGEVVRPTSKGTPMYGVAVRTSFTKEKGVFVPETEVNVMKAGVCYVQPEDTVEEGKQAYMRITAAGAEVVGAFRSDSDSGDAVPVNAVFLTDGTSSAPAKLLVLPSSNEVAGTPQTLTLENASLTADLEDFLFEVPDDKVFVVTKAVYYNATGLAEDASNYFNIKVQLDGGSQIAANWSTETGEEGTITADTLADLTLGTLANRTFLGGQRVDVMFDETGTATLPAGRIQVVGYLI